MLERPLSFNMLNNKTENTMSAINNEFKDFISHIDMMNTISGGTSLTSVVINKEEDKLLIEVSAPAVDGDAYNLLLRGNQLIIYTTLSDEWQVDVNSDKNMNKMPLFARTIDLPPFVNKDEIDAVYEDGKLNVVLPIIENNEAVKKIDIRHY